MTVGGASQRALIKSHHISFGAGTRIEQVTGIFHRLLGQGGYHLSSDA